MVSDAQIMKTQTCFLQEMVQKERIQPRTFDFTLLVPFCLYLLHYVFYQIGSRILMLRRFYKPLKGPGGSGYPEIIIAFPKVLDIFHKTDNASQMIRHPLSFKKPNCCVERGTKARWSNRSLIFLKFL